MALDSIRSNRLNLSDPYDFTGVLTKNGVPVATTNDIPANAVESIVGGTGIDIDSTDPKNPIANSVDGGNNTGWLFSTPSTDNANFLMVL